MNCINDFISYTKNIFYSTDFLDRHKKNSADFTRKPILSFIIIIVFLLNFIRAALQTELDNFFKTLLSSNMPEPEVTNSAFCQARKKLKHSAFIELNKKSINYFYKHFDFKTWHGLRLIAVDGSSIVVPKNDETIKYFHLIDTGKGNKPVVMVRISQVFDVINHISIDCTISKYAVSEANLLIKHTKHLKADDLCLLDRGYPSFWLFKYLRTNRIHFCARLTHQIWNMTIEKVLATGDKDKIIEIFPSVKSLERCKELGIGIESEKYRVLIIDGESGKQIVLITSLLDMQKYPYELFDDLYHYRWPVEESYKEWKCRIEIENFSGISVENIMQDFYANVFTVNFCSIIAYPIHEKISEKTTECRLEYQINWTAAFSRIKNTIILIFFENDINNLIKKLLLLFLKNILPRRSGRHFKRKKSYSRRRFHIPYKTIC